MTVNESCLTLCNPINCSLPGSSIPGFLQARTLEWVAIPFPRGSFLPRDWTQVSCIAGRATREAHLKYKPVKIILWWLDIKFLLKRKKAQTKYLSVNKWKYYSQIHKQILYLEIYWRRDEKETTEDEMFGWHHRLNGHELEWTLGVGDGQGGLACCSPWGRKELDTTEGLNWTELWSPCSELRSPGRTILCVCVYFYRPQGRWMKTSLWPWQAQMLPRFSICILAREEYPWALTATWWSGIQMLSRSSLPRTTSRYGLSGWAWSRVGNMGGEQGQERCEFVVIQGHWARMCCDNQSSWIPRDIKAQQFISHFCFAK